MPLRRVHPCFPKVRTGQIHQPKKCSRRVYCTFISRALAEKRRDVGKGWRRRRRRARGWRGPRMESHRESCTLTAPGGPGDVPHSPLLPSHSFCPPPGQETLPTPSWAPRTGSPRSQPGPVSSPSSPSLLLPPPPRRPSPSSSAARFPAQEPERWVGGQEGSLRAPGAAGPPQASPDHALQLPPSCCRRSSVRTPRRTRADALSPAAVSCRLRPGAPSPAPRAAGGTFSLRILLRRNWHQGLGLRRSRHRRLR